jgi:hypothetical protein
MDRFLRLPLHEKSKSKSAGQKPAAAAYAKQLLPVFFI